MEKTLGQQLLINAFYKELGNKWISTLQEVVILSSYYTFLSRQLVDDQLKLSENERMAIAHDAEIAFQVLIPYLDIFSPGGEFDVWVEAQRNKAIQSIDAFAESARLAALEELSTTRKRLLEQLSHLRE